MRIVRRVVGVPDGPARSGHISAVGVECGTVGVGDRIIVVVVDDVLMCVMRCRYVCALFRLGHVAEARVLLWERLVRSSGVIIAVYDAAVPEARQFNVLRDFEIGCLIVSSTIAFDGVEFVEVWLSDLVV